MLNPEAKAQPYLIEARERFELEDIATCMSLVEQSLEISRAKPVLRAAIRLLYDSGEITRAAQLLDEFEVPSAGAASSTDRRLIARVRADAQLITLATRAAAMRSVPIQEKCVVNVLAYSLPYSSVGYATRSHGLARGVSQAGWRIMPYTRPGFPFDQLAELCGQSLPTQDRIDEITYRRLFDVTRRACTQEGYLKASIQCYRKVFAAHRPAVVHAASNYSTALPALIAAREYGVPFVYEVRGFWDVTRASSDPEFRKSRAYHHFRLFEALVAKSADHVITLTDGMRRRLAERGVPEQRISVVPNGVDADQLIPREPDAELAAKLGLQQDVPVIGYIGSFVDYEGIDDLIAAAAILAEQGRRFQLLLVGDGLALPELRASVRRDGLEGRTVFAGRVPHEQIAGYYSLIDMCPYPRKPWEVTELVSPLKPFEAMAQEKAVLVSDTAALREMVIDERTGLVFEAGQTRALAEALDRLLGSASLRRKLGVAARRWVTANRTWRMAGEACVSVYRHVGRPDDG